MSSYVLITGAAGGIGKTTAAECASRGWNLLLTDLRADLLVPLAEGMRRMYGVEVITFSCDLTDAGSRDYFWRQVEQARIRLHFLINLAGTEFEGRFRDRSPQELQNLLRLNLEGTLVMTNQALRFRDPGQPFTIINMSSLAGFYPMPVKAVYAASKRFLIDFSVALHTELKAEGVQVMALCPSGLPTNPRSIRSLHAQGWIAQLGVMDIGLVMQRAIDRAMRGQTLYVPGIFNQFLRLLSGLLPSGVIAAFVWNRWRVKSVGMQKE